MSQASKNEKKNEILEPWMRSLHEFDNETRREIRLRANLYEAWNKKEMDSSPSWWTRAKWWKKGSKLIFKETR